MRYLTRPQLVSLISRAYLSCDRHLCNNAEQNASRALALADRGYVMESGIITMTGPGQTLLSDPRVRAAYLGE